MFDLSDLFNDVVKDTHTYFIYEGEKALVVVQNALGVNKKDLKIQVIGNGRNDIDLSIKGQTTDIVTGKTYAVNSEFCLDATKLNINKATSNMNNGLLYITIPYIEAKETGKRNIEII